MNRKVLIALAATAAVILIVAPGALKSVGPLLLVAACPLSMIFMGGAMFKTGSSNKTRPNNSCARGPEPPVVVGQEASDKDAEIARLRARLDERQLGTQQPHRN